MTKKLEIYLSGILVLFILLFGRFYLKTDILFFRLLVGVGLGYVLTRAYMGFAGSVNRAYITGSTRLMKTLMLMFFITALFSTAVLFNADVTTFDLWVNPINAGLILGGILFGFGMSFSCCCASGVLTDLASSLPRAFITLVFFCLGVFIGFPVQNSQDWINNSWFSTETGEKIGTKGVYFPDLFKFDGMQGYLGAILVTGIFCFIVVWISNYYENKRKAEGSYVGYFSEKIQDLENKKVIEKNEKKEKNQGYYYNLFVKPWSMKTGAFVISGIFVLLMGITRAGWGASTPYGFWFGKALMFFGVSPDSIESFTKMSSKPFVLPFFEHPITVQNIGIFLGALIYLLSAKLFVKTFSAEFKISPKLGIFYAIGGLCMGFGTRLANGCNVGALYTPIANFSLSGWIFLVFLVVGGVLGNKLSKKVGI
ncbi:YeeE/YedE family protein [Gemella cuniculi]|uniref:YeeE/YedE family protein n=1 Tax=Gemella cuniculi TaxID=150240 RepID=UPI0004156B59|nr:YeeE/YedE family protein [Gemella cuniculi]